MSEMDMSPKEEDFPGWEDYLDGCDPAGDRPISEQIAYWKDRARSAEAAGWITHLKLCAVCDINLRREGERREDGEDWKGDD